MANKMIGVSKELHAKVAKIAQRNYRGISDQIEYWVAKTCNHPVEMREQVYVVIAPVRQPDGKTRKTASVGANQTRRGYFCNRCGEYVFDNAAYAGDEEEDLSAALNAVLVGTAK